MNVKSVVNGLGRGDIQYLFGRFGIVRVTYSGLRRLQGWVGRTVEAEVADRPTLFSATNVDEVVQTIREDAVFVGLQLPAPIIAEIEAFGRSEPLHVLYNPPGVPTFRYTDVIRGQMKDGQEVPIGGVRQPTRCPAIRAIVEDPVLRAIVRTYLGYKPRRVMTLLNWCFAGASNEERQQMMRQITNYHYDVGGFNFVYANFYILDTDRHSGAHVMMKGSHNYKPLRMLLGSAAASEAAVRQQFGRENEIMIEGCAGIGFVQDTSCYHHATLPTERDRLMLAIRYS